MIVHDVEAPKMKIYKDHKKMKFSQLLYFSYNYKCDLCNFKRKTKKTVKKHVLKNHPETRIKNAIIPICVYNCNKCSYHSTVKSLALQHIENFVHPEDMFIEPFIEEPLNPGEQLIFTNFFSYTPTPSSFHAP